MYTEQQIRNDAMATLAAIMLSELAKDSQDGPFEDFVNFPDIPPAVRTAQHNLLVALLESGNITADESALSYVEPGCVEHDVVHVHVSGPGLWATVGYSFWLGVCPVTGEVFRC